MTYPRGKGDSLPIHKGLTSKWLLIRIGQPYAVIE